MKPIRDLMNKRFGRLLVLQQGERNGIRITWKCRCDCGNTTVVQANNLQSGNTISCGCRQKEARSEIGKRSVTHGKCKSRTWIKWQSMLARCYQRSYIQFHDYGGRGIKVCKRWWKFENFLADMGECPGGCSLDRIDGSKNYTPKNCRWATKIEQANNKRNNKRITYQGITLTVAQWSAETGIAYHTLYQRVFRYGWPIKKAFQ